MFLVIQPFADLESKIKAEGVEAHRVHGEFTALCKRNSETWHFVVNTEQKEKANLKANSEQLGTASLSLQTKINDLVGTAAATEADLKAATVFQATGTQTSQSPSRTLIRSLPYASWMWALVSACAPSRSREFSAIRGHPRGPVGCAHQVLSLLAEVPQRSTSRVDCTSTPWRSHQNQPFFQPSTMSTCCSRLQLMPVILRTTVMCGRPTPRM